MFPDHHVVFNANIYGPFGKLWYGDIDLTLDGSVLQAAADTYGSPLWVLNEKDGRFEEEDRLSKLGDQQRINELNRIAVKIFQPEVQQLQLF